MTISPERLHDLSAETGFRPGSLEKVVRLGELIGSVSRHPVLGRALVLKGGTALNLGYRNTLGGPDRIEVDLNFLFRLPLGEVQTLTLWQPRDLERPRVATVPGEELVAGKLCALLARVAPRDFYDTIRLPLRLPSVWGTARARSFFVAMSGTLDHPLHSYGTDRLARIDDDTVRSQLHPMLTSGDEPDGESLRRDTLQIVAPMLELSDPEREYVDCLQVGELRPELLFPDDPESAGRLARHPALLWKAQNARNHAAASRRNR